MAAVPGKIAPPELEAKVIRKGDLDLRLLLCRTHRQLRVLDFRVGNYLEKRDMLDALAAAEGLRKVFTLVEKSDGQSWRAVGFSKEGVIPGFFRTADGYVLTRMYEDGAPLLGGAPKAPVDRAVPQKRRFRKPDGATVELVCAPARLAQIGGPSVTEYRTAPLGGTSFEPALAVRVKLRRDELWVTAETDESFGHARFDLHSPRRGPNEQNALGHAIAVLTAELFPRGVTSLFAVAAAGDAWAAELYYSLGFRITARLADHLILPDGTFAHGHVFHKKAESKAG